MVLTPAVKLPDHPVTIVFDEFTVFSDPDTFNEPDTLNADPEANTKLDLLPLDEPFPIINADTADDDILNCPCTCWYEPDAAVKKPSAWEPIPYAMVPTPSVCEYEPEDTVPDPSACE